MPKVFIKDRFSPSIARSSMDNAAATSCMSTQDPKGDWTAWRKTAWGSQLTTLQIASLYFLTIQHHRNWKRRGFLTLRMWLLGGKKKKPNKDHNPGRQKLAQWIFHRLVSLMTFTQPLSFHGRNDFSSCKTDSPQPCQPTRCLFFLSMETGFAITLKRKAQLRREASSGTKIYWVNNAVNVLTDDKPD